MKKIKLDPRLPPHPLGKYVDQRGNNGCTRPSVRGGRVIVMGGRSVEYCPDHPNAASSGYYAQSRLVMECVLGRVLGSGEFVRFRNGDTLDIRKGNLLLADNGCAILVGDKEAAAALKGRTPMEAAAKLGIGYYTLLRRFKHLLIEHPLYVIKRRIKGEYDQMFADRIMEIARMKTGRCKAIEELGIATPTFYRACKNLRIKAVRAKSDGGWETRRANQGETK